MTTNPILNSEFRYQRFVIERSRSGGFWIFLAILLLAPALLMSIGYTIGVLLNLFPVLHWEAIPFTWHLNLFLVLLVSNVSMYVVVTLVTISLSASSIRREKDKHTWSLLRLTNISSDQIVYGKWWASLRALNGDHAMVILLRVGLLAIALGIFIPSLHSLDGITADYRLYFLLMMPLIILQGFLDAAFSAILGIAGAIPDDTGQVVGTFSVFLIRLMSGIAIAWWFWMVLLQLRYNFIGALYTTAYGIIATLIALFIALFVARVLVTRT